MLIFNSAGSAGSANASNASNDYFDLVHSKRVE